MRAKIYLARTWKGNHVPLSLKRDYTEMPHLDHYSSSQLDDETEFAPIPLAERLAIDAQLERRDLEKLKRQSRIPDIFLPSSSEDIHHREHMGSENDEDGLKRLPFESKRVHRQLMLSKKGFFRLFGYVS